LDYSKILERPTPQKWQKRIDGHSFVRDLMKRNQILSLKRPENASKNRYMGLRSKIQQKFTTMARMYWKHIIWHLVTFSLQY